jgi:hypothetical protein
MIGSCTDKSVTLTYIKLPFTVRLPLIIALPLTPKLPVVLSELLKLPVPVTLTPVPETTITLEFPDTLKVTSPFAAGIDTLLLPLLILLVLTVVQLKLPLPFVVKN